MARRPLLTDDEIVARARPVFVEHGYGVRTRHLGAAALAQIVATLLVGEVALRFVARERTWTRDPAFVDRVMRLLAATPQQT